ncbi:hypothetical protein TVAG_332020 [Trichomonas vaginalis G3]|uniref:Uncharacterized protein n=1 Tax=Trichomonas vaginalis (strain ATCC PRA-98 / G3) TaxID=412133 RepID=A2GA71_TRIV3|nr:protein of unknown function, DUF4108 family [Trichomonas vaginalis G3]EAX85945.1 hypothetical protein TVAG_332020 [Trichomonas vaginalis G3]KAI5545626.1 protein of unknown function, DUF4108 family [Trichomonas vaginalis G3]|eukprot:XP_001298875.1 hypothetical protein [Trichomonas vaginalis G3]
MDALSPILENVKQVDVYFDDYVESLYYKGKFNIKPIAFAFDNKLIENAKIWELIPNIEFITNINDKWFKRIPITKVLCKLMIKTEEKEFNEFKYHPNKVSELENEKLQKKLNDRLSNDRIEKINKLAEVAFNNEIFDEYNLELSDGL